MNVTRAFRYGARTRFVAWLRDQYALDHDRIFNTESPVSCPIAEWLGALGIEDAHVNSVEIAGGKLRTAAREHIVCPIWAAQAQDKWLDLDHSCGATIPELMPALGLDMNMIPYTVRIRNTQRVFTFLPAARRFARKWSSADCSAWIMQDGTVIQEVKG